MQVTKSLSTGRKQRESESKTTNLSLISISIKNKHIKNKVRNTVRVTKGLSVGEKNRGMEQKRLFVLSPQQQNEGQRQGGLCIQSTEFKDKK